MFFCVKNVENTKSYQVEQKNKTQMRLGQLKSE